MRALNNNYLGGKVNLATFGFTESNSVSRSLQGLIFTREKKMILLALVVG